MLEPLLFALALKRPHGGRGVELLARFIEARYPGRVTRDASGNLHLDNRAGQDHRTLFVAHLDTVHRDDGHNHYLIRGDVIHARRKQPLGADNGAGVALLCHLIDSKVPGYFIFTQGEECGGIGASYLAEYRSDLLREFDRAIAFDRKDGISVISHQGWSGRCCSDTFAEALSDALNEDPRLLYMPDDSGVYTDTAEFVAFIPECTNISVGYFDEHTPNERLDLTYFMALAEHAARISWDSLPTERDCTAADSLWDVAPAALDKYPFTLPTYRESRLTRYDYQLLEALEESERDHHRSLARMLADRMLGDDADIGHRSIERHLGRLTTNRYDQAFDDIERFGGEVAVDMLIDEILRY